MKTPLTEEEKLWFLRGYLHAKAQEFGEQFGYTTEEATQLLLLEIASKKKQEDKVR